MKKILPLLLISSVVLLLVACGKKTPPTNCPLSGNVCGITSGTIDRSDLSGSIDIAMLAIKQQDFPTLSQFVGTLGLRFSPYEHVNMTTDVVLTTTQVFNALAISAAYPWGTYDGSGEPINLGIGQYREKFVYDVDFITTPEVYHNQKFERGNIINNIFDVYSGKHIVEYHFSGFDQQYGGMDWRSLYLIFEKISGQWYLNGIVHGSRTI